MEVEGIRSVRKAVEKWVEGKGVRENIRRD
jgi:hypothetical protein